MKYLSHKHYELNTEGRDFCIGDLHGCYDVLEEALKGCNFDYQKDRMFSVGDIIDRGEQSMECLRLVDQDWFHPVLGNHEDMLLHWHETGEHMMWMMNGGLWMRDENPDELAAYAQQILENVPLAITVQTHQGPVGICHAEPARPKFVIEQDDLTDRDAHIMLWARSMITSGNAMQMEDVIGTIHGHTVIDEVKNVGSAVFIDTGVVHGGKLMMMEFAGVGFQKEKIHVRLQ